MKKKRLLSMAMALCLVLGSAAALPKNAFVDSTSISASAEVSGDYEYRVLDNGTVEITKYNGKAETLNIPSTLGGKKVTSIGMMAFAGCSCKSVTIPNSVTNIEIAAFERCTKLTSIIIPNSMTYIGRSMFNFCISLKTVNIPNSVTTIGASAFVNCSNLESVKIPSGLKVIGDGAFANCEKLKSITIPSGVTYLGMYAFQDCKSLTSVTIPNGISKIASGVFLSCTGLSNVSIPSSVTSIEYQAFRMCTGLKNITIPSSVTEIGHYAFQDCTMLSSVTIPESVTSIGEYAIGFDSEGMQTGGGFTIYGVKGTAAEKYAKDYHLKFESIPKTTRLAGKGRFETAVEISKAGFPSGSKTVVLAYGLNYADALAGVSLAKAKNAPILLTAQSYLPSETLAEIKRLKATDVIILGGTGAVGTEVEKALTDNKLNIERIAGKSRFETATKIAQKMQTLGGNKAPEDVFFVYYNDFADALSVSTVAAIKDAPVIYLKTDGELDSATSAYLASVKGKVKNAYVIGGTGVISDAMMKKAGDALGVKPTRVFGKNRFETCVAVNNNFKSVLNGDTICIATGLDFPDALAGGVFAAKNKAPLLLINGKAAKPALTDEQKAYLKTKGASSITVFGGTGVVPDSHIQTVAAASV